MYEVFLTQAALETYNAADAQLARQLNRCFDSLARNPRRHRNIRALSGALAGKWRYRVGDWRVIYTIDDAAKRVTVLLIANRRDAYR